jgi:CubicO group peptidase (beta-lactamase class C family)
MSPRLLFLYILTLPFTALAQNRYPVTYDQLKEYEGIYSYLDSSNLQIAASPRDTLLYAVIHDSKYPLRPFGRDIFLNNADQLVEFMRGRRNRINGYRVNGQMFKLIKKQHADEGMFYARIPSRNNRYVYKKTLRPKLNDGLEIGSIKGAGLDKDRIEEMVARIADGTFRDVHSVLIVQDNKLSVEEYFYEYDRNTLHQMRSATKSVISALVGIAISKGLIKSVDDTVLSYFPEYTIENPSPLKDGITIKHLLTNQAGFDCDIKNDSSAGNETVMGQSADWVKFTLDLPMLDTPGTNGRYCSGGPIVLGRIIEKVSGKPLADFAYENLFRPLGIAKYRWDFKPDRSSAETFCQLYLRPRDMIKFGMLYLNNGMWKGNQIIPQLWVSESLEKHSVVNDTEYGYLWWRQYLNAGGQRRDGIAAKGNGGQRIYLFPQYNMIAVITGGSFNVDSSSDLLLATYILPSFK